MINELSLFSGYGGFSLALQLLLGRKGVRTIGYCEIEPYCQDIIKARILDGYLDDAPIWPDIRAANFSGLCGLVDIITAGFPCQPHSVAGRRRGAGDERNLWPQTCAVIDAVRPEYILLENVPGLLQPSDGWEPYVVTVLGNLARLGYDVVWCVLGAREVGAPHRRDRWFCLGYTQRNATSRFGGLAGTEGQLAYAPSQRRRTRGDSAQRDEVQANKERLAQEDSKDRRGRQCGSDPHCGTSLAYPQHTRLEGWQQPKPSWVGADESRPSFAPLPQWPPAPGDRDGWARVLAKHPELAPALDNTASGRYAGQESVSELERERPAVTGEGESNRQAAFESPLRGVVDGSSHRVDRLKALGNGIVPQQAAEAMRLLLERRDA